MRAVVLVAKIVLKNRHTDLRLDNKLTPSAVVLRAKVNVLEPPVPVATLPALRDGDALRQVRQVLDPPLLDQDVEARVCRFPIFINRGRQRKAC